MWRNGVINVNNENENQYGVINNQQWQWRK
jgi:hypothetical protein